MPRSHWLLSIPSSVGLVLLCAGTPAIAAPAAPAVAEAPDVPVDVHDKKMIVLTDGKKHYVAVDEGLSSDALFYGDGKSFWQQRVGSGGGAKQDDGVHWTQRSMSFWDPRTTRGVEASFDLRDAKYSVTCVDRVTELKPLPEAESKALVAKAKFWKPHWKHRAHALARDNTGRYYYVDQLRDPPENKSFRLFAGPKGNLKPLKMTNVVADSEGEIYSTKAGELRLVLNKNEYAWVKDGKPGKLLPVPVEDNVVMIYTDLGVYTGQRFGTPCDDL